MVGIFQMARTERASGYFARLVEYGQPLTTIHIIG